MRMLREQAQRTPPNQWVRVIGGWSEFQFAEKRMPTVSIPRQSRGVSLDRLVAPQRLAHCSGERGKHQVEAHAHAALAAGVGIDGVMQIRRENQ